MHCIDTYKCFEEIAAYFSGKRTGHFLLVNTENYDVYQNILQRLQADNTKECIFISKNCYPNGLPDVDSTLLKGVGAGNYAILGISQALMLQGDHILEAKVSEILSQPIHGYGIILLEHCDSVLRKLIRRDERIKSRVLLIEGASSPLPQIQLTKVPTIGINTLKDFPSLLSYLEELTEMQCNHSLYITVVTELPPAMFKHSLYAITESVGIYGLLAKQYADIAGATLPSYGTESQWNWLAENLSCRFVNDVLQIRKGLQDLPW